MQRASLRRKEIDWFDAVAERLRTYLEAYTSLRRYTGTTDGAGVDRPLPRRRLGDAFAAFLEAVDPSRLPLHGGDATTLLVTLDLATLTSKLAGVGLVGDEPISAARARQTACTAQIVPVVGGASQVLDLGRSRRLFTPAQRKAMAVRDRRCRTEGCTIPASWCEATTRLSPGLPAAEPTSPTVSCCVPGTTIAPTTRRTTRSVSRTVTSGCTAARDRPAPLVAAATVAS